MLAKKYHQIDFADSLRKTTAEAFGIPLAVFQDDARKEKPLPEYGYPNETPRSLLIAVGTDLFRSRWPDIWVDSWENKARRLPLVVVTDLRFPNELGRVRAMGATVIRITRPGVPIVRTEITESFFEDFDVDFDLVNDGTPEELGEKVLAALHAMEVSP